MEVPLEGLNLVAVASRLRVSAFEVIRLLVAAGGVPSRLRFTEAQVASLRELGQIEASWWRHITLPEDDDPMRARVRGALSLLLDRGHIAESMTRRDNVSRGLTPEEAEWVHAAIDVLVDEGHVVREDRPHGTMISVHAGSSETIQKIVAGIEDTRGLAALYEG